MEKLLNLLADGHFHSGEELGETLGVSRAAVWKKLKALEELGLSLDSVRGKGYRLGNGVELLDRKKIEAGLDESLCHAIENHAVTLHTCFSTGSTNDLVKEVSDGQPGRMTFCLAEHQTSGRGRRGRTWVSPFGSTISMSANWRISEGTASLEGLSLAVGLAVLKALEANGARNLELKWPNDVLWQGKKLSGILLEVHGDPTGECDVIIGIGINIKLSEEQKKGIGQPAVDLYQVCGKAVSRNAVVAQLINTLSHMLEGFSHGGFALYKDQWSEYDAFRGQEVSVEVTGRKEKGLNVGVNEQGGLLIKTETGVKVFNGGEVSLRKS
ncbi:bifunctional biotin--[acetyl-CoA-carboxylase] ligase/biotin operon repressor BirA [Endozoicomonas euniceicola]|uniref:Bifunctional ligase/repressor BirA n=1 Tax=Endozoicomonas euniceicola TaxID=1234143 RepID=A0ABY6GMB9_9GAMM|nr:bifunctional biotin--[acetyl-CoA-carboxylase] ligase/biotin operon repressor BirA [Endozoicomonas euniceicola]UYM13874.1 bifunctional biotin--[acetyl-CoA-carboxylase] ligase/biotin operon repressor BirA [Endozoicomonas euniceicola]